jgi:mRNA interferase RelE/StbE
MYKIEFSEKAEKQLQKLEDDTAIRIVSSLERTTVRPYYFVKRLEGTKYYRFRVGDYRIILDIQNDRLIIIVIELGHRKNIYK